MKVFVTGGGGFLGRFLCAALQQDGHHVIAPTSKVCDLRKDDSLSQFDGILFDQIFHLAVWTQAGDFCLQHPGEQWLFNQAINTNVLHWWQKKQPQAKLITLGTSCAYDPSLPLSEEYYLSGTPIPSLFSYAMTKRMLLAGLLSFQQQFNLEYLYVIPSTLYGPYYHSDGRQLHFIFDLIHKILRGKLYTDPVILWGDGEQKRELIHVSDFVHTLLQLNQSQKTGCFNIGSGIEYSIKEFAQMICEIVDYPVSSISYDITRYVGARSKVLNVQKFKEQLPQFTPKTLFTGLQETVSWFGNKILSASP